MTAFLSGCGQRLIAVIAATLAALTSAPAHPVETLLKRVPPETALCLIVRDLNQHTQTVRQSPFAKWFETSAFGKPFLNAYRTAVPDDLDKQLAAQFGTSTNTLLEDVFGDAVVFAYAPGPNGQPDGERGLLLIAPRKPDAAAKFMARLDELQLKSGELTSVRAVDAKPVAITVRTKANGKTEAYLLHDNVLAFASDQALMTSYAEWLASGKAPAPVQASLERLQAGSHLATFWLNPRHFDAAFQAAVRSAAPADRDVAAWMVTVWGAVQDLAVQLDLGSDAKLTLAIRWNADRMPASLKPILSHHDAGTNLWSSIPNQALLAIAGRATIAEWLTVADEIASTSPKPSDQIKDSLRPIVGQSRVPGLLKATGPDWAFWTEAPTTGDIPQATLAVRIDPASAKAMLDSLDAVAQLIRIAYNASNSDAMELTDRVVDGVRVRTLSGEKLPSGVRPAYAIKDQFLILVTSPERITAFRTPSGPANASAPILRLSVTELRKYLDRHGEGLSKWIAESQNRSVHDVLADLQYLVAMSEPITSIELTHRHDHGRSTLTVTIKPIEALKK